MSRLIRHLSTHVLCLMVLAGHVPAWLHVVSCHSGSCSSGEVIAPSACCCGHNHDAVRGVESSTAGPDRHSPASRHDSDHCPICQTLSAPLGFLGVDLPLVSTEPTCRINFPAAIRCVLETIVPLPPVRGPPALLV